MKSYIRLFIFLCILIGLTIPGRVVAEENMNISVDYGVDGKVQLGRGFPMKITLTNEGEDFSGDLVIFNRQNYLSAGNLVVSVELAKKEKKMIHLTVPGLEESFFYQQPSNQQDFIRLFENDWKNGKEVELKGKKTITPAFFPENRLVIGVLSDTPDSLNFLKLTSFNGEPVEFLPINDDDLPEESKGFEVFDVIVMNDFNLASISVQKQEALRNWVKSGGHFIFGSNPSISQTLGEVSELSLLTINKQETFSELNFLSNKDKENTPDFKKVEIMSGEVRENSKILYTDHSLPIVINKSFGFGEVTQFAFNIGNNTLKNWEPYSKWWNDVLLKTVDKDRHGQQRYQIEEITNQFKNIVEAYPSSFLPLNTLIILFVVYLLILIPGLYVILKKFDKRENSWWIIPTVAIISSIAIFAVGAKDRIAGSQVNDISLLAIDDTGSATGYGAVSILTNSGGDYSLITKPSEFDPFPINSNINGSSNDQLNDSMVEKGKKQTKLTFNSVDFWSIRSAVGEIQETEIGTLTSDFVMENEKLVGTITSSLPINLNETFLLTGSKAYPLGAISANSTESISIDLEQTTIDNLVGAPHSSAASSVFPGFYNAHYGGSNGPTDKDNLVEWKKFELLNTVMNQGIYQKDLNQPLLVGFSDDSLLTVNMDQKKVDPTSLTLVTQVAQVTPSLQGSFTLTESGLQPKLSHFEGSEGYIIHNGLLDGENFVDVEPGKYLVTLQLPGQIEADQVTLKKLKLTLPRENETAFFLYNSKQNEYISLDNNQATITFEKEVNDFLSKDGSILIMFEKNGMNNPMVQVPTIKLEGEYK